MTAKKLAVVVAMTAMTAVPAHAQEDGTAQNAQRQAAAQEVAGGAQYDAPQARQGEEVSVTGVVKRLPSDGGPSPYGITDEASGAGYVLDRGEGDYGAYEGQRVTITGLAETDPNAGFNNLQVGEVLPASDDGAGGPSGDRTATLSFEVTTDCAPPEGTTLLGFVPAEGGISAGLADPDGDGVYTGSVDVPRFAPGPTPPGTEPVSVPVQVVLNNGDDSGNVEVIEDFGVVKLDGDEAFSADGSFCDDGTGDGGGGSGSGGGSAVVSGGSNNADKGSGSVDANAGGSADGNGSAAASGGAAKDGAPSVAQGSASPIMSVLPATGGVLPVAGAAGALLLAGGLLLRRISR